MIAALAIANLSARMTETQYFATVATSLPTNTLKADKIFAVFTKKHCTGMTDEFLAALA